jgi:hypothetical protein
VIFGRKRRIGRPSTLEVTEVFVDHDRSNHDRVRLHLRGRSPDGADRLWEGQCLRYKVPRVGDTLPVSVSEDDPTVVDVRWREVAVDVDPPLDALFQATITRRVGDQTVIVDMAEAQPLIDRLRRDGGLPPADMERLLYLLGERDR